jgi:transposase
LAGFYEGLNTRQLTGIQAVAMDMWKPFLRATRDYVPQADEKIVFDRFHIMKHMNQAVDEVRKYEHKSLRKEGEDTLSGTKYLWLFAEENLPQKHQERFATLKGLHLKTARAWAIKEMLRDLWKYKRRGWAVKHFRGWNRWATRSRLEPVRKVAAMLRGHLSNVLTYFDHRLTNAASEGMNIRAVSQGAPGRASARMSSICASIVAASPVHERSDVPLPRRSKTNTRPIVAKPRTNDTNGGKSQAASMLE